MTTMTVLASVLSDSDELYASGLPVLLPTLERFTYSAVWRATDA